MSNKKVVETTEKVVEESVETVEEVIEYFYNSLSRNASWTTLY